MKALTLLYHDVVPAGDWQVSGFTGRAEDTYKLQRSHFEQHLSAVSAAAARRGSVRDLLEPRAGDAQAPVLLTFDDGGASAAYVADSLERAGWVGHFLITTDYLDARGFVTRAQLRDIAARGHVIGSHSCSHPLRMAKCPWLRLLEEWRRSTGVLAEVLGTAVDVASVPNGSFSRRVAAAATASGIRALFTSEPTEQVRVLDGCLVIGRFCIRHDTPAATAASLASGAPWTRLAQFCFWNVKKLAKVAGGGAYVALRRAVYR